MFCQTNDGVGKSVWQLILCSDEYKWNIFKIADYIVLVTAGSIN